MTDGTPLELIDQIYDAALHESGFERLAPLLATATQSANAVVIIRNGMVPVELSATTSPEALQQYLAYYGYIDPWARLALQAPHWEIVDSRQQVSEQELLRSEFYVDYARHLDMHQPMGMACPLDTDLTLTVGVHRARTAPEFGSDDQRALVHLLKHLQRGMQLRLRLGVLQTRADVGSAVLASLAFGVVVADRQGRVVFANASAEALHRANAGLCLIRGKLAAAAPAEARTLAGLIQDATAGGAGGAMRLTGGNGDRLLALVTPLPRQLREGGSEAPLALVSFRRGSDTPAFLERVLATLYGLSRAEAQVVRALGSGASLEAIALDRGVKPSTLKSQLEAIFRKTGAENQRDLIRLIGSLPQISSGAEGL